MFNHKFALLFSFCLLLSACQQFFGPQPEPQKVLGERSELTDSHWQLVQIQSMDDTVYQPQARQNYSLAFEADGKLLVQADCNRGAGSWTSTQAGQLNFGPIALTRMACPPGSIDGRFNSNLAYVRSYVLKDNNLYLATMADGAILEFEPYGKPAFDCADSKSSAETLVCEDPELSRLDLRLNQLFETALQTDSDTQTLRAYQRGWIKGRDDCWKAPDLKSCVMDEYKRRITQLEIQTGATQVPKPVIFSCQDGTLASAYFYRNTEIPSALLNRDQEQRLLYQVRSASGAHYQGRNVDFWNKGDSARLEWDASVTACEIKLSEPQAN